MSGGKRIRPALMYYGYLAYGGRKSKNILQATMSLELLHAMLLIQDDIIDKDNKRHNIKNIHVKFGLEYAVVIGDIIYAWANKILLKSNFEFSF